MKTKEWPKTIASYGEHKEQIAKGQKQNKEGKGRKAQLVADSPH